MGAGASSLMRLRKTLVIRAYNTRKRDQTLEEQFRPYLYKKDIKKELSLDAPWVDDLFRRCIGDSPRIRGEADQPPPEPKLSHSRSVPVYMPPEGLYRGNDRANPAREKRSSQRRSREGSSSAGDIDGETSRHISNLVGEIEIPSSVSGRILSDLRGREAQGEAADFESIHGQDEDTWHGRGTDESGTEPHTGDYSIHARDAELEGPERVEYSVDEAPSDDDELDPRSLRGVPEADDEPARRPPSSPGFRDGRGSEALMVRGRRQVSTGSSSNPTKPLWRKREVVKQERTVHYTTVDAEGVQQELVERETTETEVLHMECRETGEFAHRETSIYAQQELFNNEVVAEESGTEEYVHLKSLEDEFECMNSTMPRKPPPPDSASPGAAGAGEGGQGEHYHNPNQKQGQNAGDEGVPDDSPESPEREGSPSHGRQRFRGTPRPRSAMAREEDPQFHNEDDAGHLGFQGDKEDPCFTGAMDPRSPEEGFSLGEHDGASSPGLNNARRGRGRGGGRRVHYSPEAAESEPCDWTGERDGFAGQDERRYRGAYEDGGDFQLFADTEADTPATETLGVSGPVEGGLGAQFGPAFRRGGELEELARTEAEAEYASPVDGLSGASLASLPKSTSRASLQSESGDRWNPSFSEDVTTGRTEMAQAPDEVPRLALKHSAMAPEEAPPFGATTTTNMHDID